MKFLLGLVTGILIWVLVGGLVALNFNASATTSPSTFERSVFTTVLNRSVARRAPKVELPLGDTPAVIAEGLDHYRANCLPCHGAPGIDPHELAQGLNPPAPGLDSVLVQDRPDGELFWITSSGIRMTGMPAFSPSHSEREIWTIVRFLRRLPVLTPEERILLGLGQEEHHHGPEEGDPTEKEHIDPPGAPPHKH